MAFFGHTSVKTNIDAAVHEPQYCRQAHFSEVGIQKAKKGCLESISCSFELQFIELTWMPSKKVDIASIHGSAVDIR